MDATNELLELIGDGEIYFEVAEFNLETRRDATVRAWEHYHGGDPDDYTIAIDWLAENAAQPTTMAPHPDDEDCEACCGEAEWWCARVDGVSRHFYGFETGQLSYAEQFLTDGDE